MVAVPWHCAGLCRSTQGLRTHDARDSLGTGESRPSPPGTAEPVFYAGLPQQEALARLRFLVHNQRRLGLMLGEAGWGKSLVLALFAEEAAARRLARCPAQSARALGPRVPMAACASGCMPVPGRATTACDSHVGSKSGSSRTAFKASKRCCSSMMPIRRGPICSRNSCGSCNCRQHGGESHHRARGECHASTTAGSAGCLDLVDLRIDLEPWDAARHDRLPATRARGGRGRTSRFSMRLPWPKFTASPAACRAQ